MIEEVDLSHIGCYFSGLRFHYNTGCLLILCVSCWGLWVDLMLLNGASYL